jgi:hypothetical protein
MMSNAGWFPVDKKKEKEDKKKDNITIGVRSTS